MRHIKWSIVLVVFALVAGLGLKKLRTGNEVSKEKFLFDTFCNVTAYGKDAGIATDDVFERLEEIHGLTNVFSEDSEVFRINSAKAGEVVEVSDELAEILTVAQSVEVASGGAFDVSIAPVVMLWQFDGEGRVPDDTEIAEALAVSGSGIIMFDKEKKTVVKSHDEAKIDLGGVAKGYAGDEAVRILAEYEVSGAIIDLGGNICCIGKNPNTANGKWRIGVQTPFAATGEYDEENIIEISEGAVVTSGTYQRYFEKDGKTYHHIIDPKTGRPAQRDYSSVTVVVSSSLLGDCLSTACFVVGGEEAEKLAEEFGAEIFIN